MYTHIQRQRRIERARGIEIKQHGVKSSAEYIRIKMAKSLGVICDAPVVNKCAVSQTVCVVCPPRRSHANKTRRSAVVSDARRQRGEVRCNMYEYIGEAAEY